MMRRSRFAFAFTGIAALAAFTGCGESLTSRTGGYPTGTSHADEDAPQVGHFEVCKEGTDATFEVSVDGDPPTTVDIADGNCQVVATVSSSAADVSVTEVVGPDMELVQIVRDSFWVNDDGAVGGSTTLTSTNTVSGVIYGDVGFITTFQNRPVSGGGGEGCTPGYWKQRHHLDSWEGHAPSDVLSDAGFTPPSQFDRPEHRIRNTDVTLLDALQLRGGGVNALTRHAVAALLNASSSGVSYDLTESDVVSRYNAAVAGGDVSGTKDAFAQFNEQGCPLN